MILRRGMQRFILYGAVNKYIILRKNKGNSVFEVNIE